MSVLIESSDQARRLAWKLARGGSSLERLATARALAGLHERARSAVPDLVSLLQHRDHEIVAAAAFVLADLGPIAFESENNLEDHLLLLVAHEQNDVRLWAIQALARQSSPSKAVLCALGDSVTDPDDAIAHAAIDGLARVGSGASEYVDELTRVALHGHAERRRAALHALTCISPMWDGIPAGRRSGARSTHAVGFAELVSRYAPTSPEAAEIARGILESDTGTAWRVIAESMPPTVYSEKIVTALANRMSTSSRLDGIAAANALGQAHAHRALATAHLVEHTEDNMCGWAACCALIALWHDTTGIDEAVGAALGSFLRSNQTQSDLLVVLAAMQEMAAIPPACSQPLLGRARRGDTSVRCAAIHVLSLCGIVSQSVAASLRPLLEDPSDLVRIAVCRCLAAIEGPSPSLVAVLSAVVDRGEASVRARAMQAIATMGLDAEAAMTHLESALRDPNAAVREVAAMSLERIESAIF